MTTVAGAMTSMVEYLISVAWHGEIWQIIVASVFALAGLAMDYAAIPTLVMAEVPYSMTGLAIGVNALMRSVGTSSGATVTGMVLAVQFEPSAGFAAPSPGGFVATFWLGVAAAALAAVLFWISGRRRPRKMSAPGQRSPLLTRCPDSESRLTRVARTTVLP
ncbi:hypothetical protein GCM10009813_24610 [Brevibacterium marinum]